MAAGRRAIQAAESSAFADGERVKPVKGELARGVRPPALATVFFASENAFFSI
jgi:hypothetical protein